MLERYPELAVPDKNVPPERNGFLKWLEFAERFESGTASRGSTSLPIPDALLNHLDHDALIDQHAGYFAQIVQAYEGHTVSEWPDIAVTSYPDDSHLSRSSRQLTQQLFIGERAWSRGLEQRPGARPIRDRPDPDRLRRDERPAVAARSDPRPALCLGPRHPGAFRPG